MSREISLFSDYHNKENTVTNYCGLIMKLLYEENPKSFEEVLASLLMNDANLTVGPIFSQQTKKVKSIPDLAITQKSFSIFFETKLSDWFYSDQIERHMKGFNPNTDVNILFLLSNFETDDLENRFEKEIETAKSQEIILQPISFEDFLGALENIRSSEYFKNLLEEFKIYLDRNGHLPKWKYLLDVVNCSGTMNEVRKDVYMCPDQGGAYSHRRAKYFGPYKSKEVGTIYEIRAIVIIEKNLGDGKIKWNNTGEENKTLINDAKEKIQPWEWRINENKETDLQVFLLHNGFTTQFIKDTSGGMQQSKKYFWDIAKKVNAENSEQLASNLKNRKWSELEK